MKRLIVNKRLYRDIRSIWTPPGHWGWFWRSIIFLPALTTFILLFCLPAPHPDPSEPELPEPFPDTICVPDPVDPEPPIEPEQPEQPEQPRQPEQKDNEPKPHTGDVQILLSWNNDNDLDLHCTDPAGETICFSNKVSRSGGQLDVDMNVREPYSTSPIENIYWPHGSAPAGQYSVKVKFYKKRSNPSSAFTVTVKLGDEKSIYEGRVTTEKEVVDVCTFNYMP